MDHGLDIERRVRDDLLRLGKRARPAARWSPTTRTTSRQDDSIAHEVLLCVQTGKTMADPNRFKLERQRLLREVAGRDARHLGRVELPEALRQHAADRRAGRRLLRGLRLPQPDAPVPGARRRDRGVVAAQGGRPRAGPALPRRGPRGPLNGRPSTSSASSARWASPATSWSSPTSCTYAKQEGIRVGPGRGSAAGALIAYALGITELDPLAHGLIFERFLNPERISMPDIDMDFDERRRGDMIRYVTERYGEERVAQIVTFGTIKAKAAIKDSARVLGYPYAVGDRITKAMPPRGDGQGHPAVRHLRPRPPAVHRGGRVPRPVRGRARRPEGGRHRPRARGADPPDGRARGRRDPVPRAADRRHPDLAARADGAIITAVRHARLRVHGPAQDGLPRPAQPHRAGRLPGGASSQPGRRPGPGGRCRWTTARPTSCWPAATRSACSSSTAGRCGRCCGSMVPDNFEDISAVLALYRPGPMGANAHNDYADRKNGRKPVVPIHPELAEPLAEILGETYGLIVYQEQVMAIAQKLAGYSLGKADLLRRAMGKKKKEILDKEFVPFSAGMREHGYSDDAIKTMWDILVPFSDYAFNKAHYGRVRAGLVLDGVPQGQLPGRVHGRAADQRRRRQGQVRGLPGRVPADGHQGAAAGRERVQRPVRRGRRRHPVRPGRGPQRRRQRGRVDRAGAARRRARTPTSTTSSARSTRSSATRRPIESLIKAGAFDSLGHTRRACWRCTPTRSTRSST